LNINAYWKDFLIQTSVQIIFDENSIKLDKKLYQFTVEKNLLQENFSLEKFHIENSFLKIVPTPLTRNNCQENFYIKQNELFFKTYPILSDLCFFELQLTNNITVYSSQVQVSFSDSQLKPKFSSKIYQFYVYHQENVLRVFTKSSNSIEYQLENNPYGLIINQTNGVVTFKYGLDLIKDINRIQLKVYAVDQTNYFNDSALIDIYFKQKQQFEIPRNYSQISACSNVPIVLSDQSLPGKWNADEKHCVALEYISYVRKGFENSAESLTILERSAHFGYVLPLIKSK
jgi:hypothetical protein